MHNHATRPAHLHKIGDWRTASGEREANARRSSRSRFKIVCCGLCAGGYFGGQINGGINYPIVSYLRQQRLSSDHVKVAVWMEYSCIPTRLVKDGHFKLALTARLYLLRGFEDGAILPKLALIRYDVLGYRVQCIQVHGHEVLRFKMAITSHLFLSLVSSSPPSLSFTHSLLSPSEFSS